MEKLDVSIFLNAVPQRKSTVRLTDMLDEEIVEETHRHTLPFAYVVKILIPRMEKRVSEQKKRSIVVNITNID